MLSVKCVFLIWQETNGGIVILKTVLKSDLWPGSEKCGFNPKLEDNDLKSGCYRVPKLPPLSVNYVCPISHKTNHPIMIPKIVLKSVLWRGSESALNCCIFQLLCFSLHPIAQILIIELEEQGVQRNNPWVRTNASRGFNLHALWIKWKFHHGCHAWSSPSSRNTVHLEPISQIIWQPWSWGSWKFATSLLNANVLQNWKYLSTHRLFVICSVDVKLPGQI